jgi:uncharacterized membrane protein YidH (DUF202 family)
MPEMPRPAADRPAADRPAADRPADPGLARARTDLAWIRTAIAFAALGGVVLKNHPVPGLAILALSALIWALGRLAGTTSAPRNRSRSLLVITVAVTAVSLTALVISLLSPGPAPLR